MNQLKATAFTAAVCMALSGTLQAMPKANTLHPLTAFAEETDAKEYEGLQYDFSEDSDGKYAYITGFSQNVTPDITLPAELGGAPLRYIDSYALQNCVQLHSLVIPDGVAIKHHAFKGCSNLESVKLPSDLKELGNQTFANCDSLKEIDIPDSVSKITGEVFLNCSALKKAKLPNNPELTSVSSGLFSGCYALEPVAVPESLAGSSASYFMGGFDRDYIIYENQTELGSDADFSNFRKLTEIVLAKDVTKLSTRALRDCPSLKRITILNPDCEIEWRSSDVSYEIIIAGKLSSTAQSYAETTGKRYITMENDTLLTPLQYTVPDALSCINTLNTGDAAMVSRISDPAAYMSELNIPEQINGLPVTQIRLNSAPGQKIPVINIPKTVTYIDTNYFSLNPSLEAVNVDPENEFYSSVDGVLYNKDQTELVFFPPAKNACVLQIPETVTKIGDNAFENCAHIGFVTVPEHVKEIGSAAFRSMKALVSLDLSAMTEAKIGSDAAQNNSNLTKLVLPKDLTAIPNGLCSSNSNLAAIELPESVTVIGDDAFSDCSKLQITSLPENLTTLGRSAFSSCNLTGEIVIPEGVTELPSRAFASNQNLTRITISNPACTIYDSGDTISSDYGYNEKTQIYGAYFTGTICGYTGSAAEEYPEKYGCTFESLGVYEPETTEPETSTTESITTATETVTDDGTTAAVSTTVSGSTDAVPTTTASAATTDAPTSAVTTSTTKAPTTTVTTSTTKAPTTTVTTSTTKAPTTTVTTSTTKAPTTKATTSTTKALTTKATTSTTKALTTKATTSTTKAPTTKATTSTTKAPTTTATTSTTKALTTTVTTSTTKAPTTTVTTTTTKALTCWSTTEKISQQMKSRRDRLTDTGIGVSPLSILRRS